MAEHGERCTQAPGRDLLGSCPLSDTSCGTLGTNKLFNLPVLGSPICKMRAPADLIPREDSVGESTESSGSQSGVTSPPREHLEVSADVNVTAGGRLLQHLVGKGQGCC